MAKAHSRPENDASTEDKIKQAARQIFHQKGFAGTRTRDIAEAAGINLALLNYYFRSKEKLFDLIMLETLQGFLQTIGMTVNNPSTTLDQKIEMIAGAYIDLLTREPEIPLFIMSELRSHPGHLLENMRPKEMLLSSVLIQQFQQAIKEEKIPPQNLMHFLMNLLGLITFPFIASPIFKHMGDLSDQQYNQLIAERKKLIPLWIEAMLNVKP